MKTLTMEPPEGLLGWLEQEAKRARRPKSALVPEILLEHQPPERQSAFSRAVELREH